MPPSDDPPIEVELKLMLPDQAAYDAVRAWLDASSTSCRVRSQRNLYLDTADLRLRAQRAMLRLRFEPDHVVATLKTRPNLQAGLMRTEEREAPLDADLAARFRARVPSRVDPDVLPLAAALRPLLGDAEPAPALFALGALINERRSYALPRALLDGGPGTVPIDLDHSLGPAGTPRLEVELEHSDAAALEDALYARILDLGVAASPSEQSKYAWFLEGLASTVRDEPSEA